ncbi:MAG: cation transporter [Acidobacteria bacterium]|nr:cation transporter [Acidobacteriota bacterium]
MPHSAERYRAVSRVLLGVLAANLSVALAKIAFGYATQSVAIISDGYHSLTDSFSNVIGLVGLRAARKPPDLDHPYGHRKYETLTAAGIFVSLILVVEEVVRTALAHLRHGAAATVTSTSFVVMTATVAVNLAVVAYERRKGRQLSSELLLADAMHTRSDVYTSLGVIASLVGVRLGYPILDPIGGLVVAFFIALAGLQIARDTARILSDRFVMDESDIRDVVMSVPDVMGCHHIRTRGSADHVFLDLHVWMSGDAPLAHAHHVSHVVKDTLIAKFPQIADAIIHIEPPPRGVP